MHSKEEHEDLGKSYAKIALNLVLKFQISTEMVRKMLFRGCFFVLFNLNGTLSAYLKRFSLVFDEKCVSLHCHSLLCHLQGSTVSRTLHNVKASSMFCQLAILNVRYSRLMDKHKVGSGCY